jgi:hypothetical protein
MDPLGWLSRNPKDCSVKGDHRLWGWCRKSSGLGSQKRQFIKAMSIISLALFTLNTSAIQATFLGPHHHPLKNP